MSEKRRDEVQILLRAAHAELIEVVNAIADFREFFSERNIGLLNLWAQHPGSDIARLGATFVRSGFLFVIRLPGQRAEERVRVILSAALFQGLPTVGSLS